MAKRQEFRTNVTHEDSGSVEYWAWIRMKRRCRDNAHCFADYKGRGITVCSAWVESYQAFLEHMGRRPSPSHSLDRIDNDRGYEPGNVRWATMTQQSRNRRSNRVETIGGVAKTLEEWIDHYRVPRRRVHSRLGRGWSLIDALTRPKIREVSPNAGRKRKS